MATFQQINVHEAHDLIKKGNVLLVDIRDRASYEADHIAQAVLVNDHNIKEFLAGSAKDKDLICYCYHGIGSLGAAQFFQENGFENVYSIEGGFEQWRKVYDNL